MQQLQHFFKNAQIDSHCLERLIFFEGLNRFGGDQFGPLHSSVYFSPADKPMLVSIQADI
ncbi:hypothetical protein D3C75_1338510 [compost metagenome]